MFQKLIDWWRNPPIIREMNNAMLTHYTYCDFYDAYTHYICFLSNRVLFEEIDYFFKYLIENTDIVEIVLGKTVYSKELDKFNIDRITTSVIEYNSVAVRYKITFPELKFATLNEEDNTLHYSYDEAASDTIKGFFRKFYQLFKRFKFVSHIMIKADVNDMCRIIIDQLLKDPNYNKDIYPKLKSYLTQERIKMGIDIG